MRPSTGKTFRKIITREQIQQPAVAYYGVQPGGIGYLCLTSYTENCARDVRRAVLDMKHQGMKSLVLDLRGNGAEASRRPSPSSTCSCPRARPS